MKKTLIILFIFLGILISQDSTKNTKSSQKSTITNVIIDNSTPNSIVTSVYPPFYLGICRWRIVYKILAILFIIAVPAFVVILIKVTKDIVS